MIFTIIGNTKKARDEVIRIRSLLKKKQPDAEEIVIGEEAFSKEFLEERIASQGLFMPKNIIILEGVMDKAEHKEVLLENIEHLKKSDHAFILAVESVGAKDATVIKEASFDYKDLREAARETAPSFALAESLGNKDKLQLWKVYTERLLAGDKVEELHGQLVWQGKAMLLASKTKNPAEADMKEYPYKKAKSFAKNYSEEELEELVFKLVSIYHEAHRGGVELETSLEKLILELAA
jgi:hypothetical protein